MKPEPIQRYGKLVTTGNKQLRGTVKDPDSKRNVLVEVKCDCGTVKWVYRGSLLPTKTRAGLMSCGCVQHAPRKVCVTASLPQNTPTRMDIAIPSNKAKRVHTYWKFRKSNLRIYAVWSAMLHRTNSELTGRYRRMHRSYVERGIEVCKEWVDSFDVFCEWALNNGYENKLTLDRKNNDKNYTPDNCRWITTNEQNRNKCTNRFITAWGETKCQADWMQDTRVVFSIVCALKRVDSGWSIEDALSTPQGCLPGTSTRIRPIYKYVSSSCYIKRHNPKYDATAFGETKRIKEWAEDPRCVVSREVLRDRLARGILSEDAITRPNHWRFD
jgi:hypothetical protein